jgi:hypothetical protein
MGLLAISGSKVSEKVHAAIAEIWNRSLVMTLVVACTQNHGRCIVGFDWGRKNLLAPVTRARFTVSAMLSPNRS